VPPEIAERLIVFGFFNEVIDRLPKFADVEMLRSAVNHKLNPENEVAS